MTDLTLEDIFDTCPWRRKYRYLPDKGVLHIFRPGQEQDASCVIRQTSEELFGKERSLYLGRGYQGLMLFIAELPSVQGEYWTGRGTVQITGPYGIFDYAAGVCSIPALKCVESLEDAVLWAISQGYLKRDVPLFEERI